MELEELNFGSNDHIYLPTKHHGEVSLSKWKWDLICSQPERQWYKFNSGKVPTTLVTPDYVRYHSQYEGQVIYYKEFNTCKMGIGVEIPARRFGFFAVVVDTKTKKICTVYPVKSPKKGKELEGG